MLLYSQVRTTEIQTTSSVYSAKGTGVARDLERERGQVHDIGEACERLYVDVLAEHEPATGCCKDWGRIRNRIEFYRSKTAE